MSLKKRIRIIKKIQESGNWKFISLMPGRATAPKKGPEREESRVGAGERSLAR